VFEVSGEVLQRLLSDNGEFEYETFELFIRAITDFDSNNGGPGRSCVVMHPGYAVSYHVTVYYRLFVNWNTHLTNVENF
jgi:hypothetical protein